MEEQAEVEGLSPSEPTGAARAQAITAALSQARWEQLPWLYRQAMPLAMAGAASVADLLFGAEVVPGRDRMGGRRGWLVTWSGIGVLPRRLHLRAFAIVMRRDHGAREAVWGRVPHRRPAFGPMLLDGTDAAPAFHTVMRGAEDRCWRAALARWCDEPDLDQEWSV